MITTMKSPTALFVAGTCLMAVLLLAGCSSRQHAVAPGPGMAGAKDSPPVERLTLTAKPGDRLVKAGQPASFDIEVAVNLEKDTLSYQWLFNGEPIDLKANATAQDRTLVIPSAGTNDVGFYTCIVTAHDKAAAEPPATVIPEPGQLTVYTDGSIIVSGTPLAGAASPSGTCPRPYIGYVNFRNPNRQNGGWIWDPASTVHTATDLNCAGERPKTQVKYWGNKGLDQRCATEKVTVANAYGSTSYVFTVFFPRTDFSKVPGAPYTVELVGFKP